MRNGALNISTQIAEVWKPTGSHSADKSSRLITILYTVCAGSVRTLFFYFALQCHLLASCCVNILEVSAVAVYNFKAQASLHHVF
jgi:hypothetical protein